MTLKPGDNYIDLNSGRLKYRYKPGKTDRRRILLVFSGFRPKGTLDFQGRGFDPVREDIIWIYDEFGDNNANTYYAYLDGTNTPTRLVEEFVDVLTQYFNIPRSYIVATGFSKGGSAALYHTLKLNLGGCMVTVPQFKVGQYLKKNWPTCAEEVSGGNQTIFDVMDKMLPDLIDTQALSKIPIIILTSENDHQYEQEIEPSLHSLRRMQNFSLIRVNSRHISEHIDVTPYSVPLVQAVLLLLLDGLNPHLGEQVVEDYQELTSPIANKDHGKLETKLRKLHIENTRLFLEADTIVRGYPVERHGQMNRNLIVGEDTFRLGSLIDNKTTTRNTRWEYVDYSAGLTATLGRKGIPIGDFPLGHNRLRIAVEFADRSFKAERDLQSDSDSWGGIFEESYAFRYVNTQEHVYVDKLLIEQIRVVDKNEYNYVEQFQITQDGKLTLHGRLAPRGAVLRNWGDGVVRLLLESIDRRFIFPLGLLERPNGVAPSQSKSAYATLRREPLDLAGSIPRGVYRCSVLVMTRDIFASSGIIGVIAKDESGFHSIEVN
ncbi:hypothetical protein [Corynebacterium sp. HMSC08D02]|uniref:hypothetical protein n=1 Tax=Corynebacterium sp. HMSC08D02 TaxID=1581138 RepID=UPI00114CF4B7|nr:hypothetical protein [Corynebacterium sp. HMSC08D02]